MAKDLFTDAATQFETFLAGKGLRHTDQRRQILKVFLSTERHVTTQQLYDLVRRKHEGIGYATVARTVKLMDEAGICRRVDFGDGSHRFEHKYGHEHHDHLICVACGGFVEIYSPQLEKIQDRLVAKHGYTQQYHKLDIFGLCPACLDRKSQKK